MAKKKQLKKKKLYTIFFDEGGILSTVEASDTTPVRSSSASSSSAAAPSSESASPPATTSSSSRPPLPPPPSPSTTSSSSSPTTSSSSISSGSSGSSSGSGAHKATEGRLFIPRLYEDHKVVKKDHASVADSLSYLPDVFGGNSSSRSNTSKASSSSSGSGITLTAKELAAIQARVDQSLDSPMPTSRPSLSSSTPSGVPKPSRISLTADELATIQDRVNQSIDGPSPSSSPIRREEPLSLPIPEGLTSKPVLRTSTLPPITSGSMGTIPQTTPTTPTTPTVPTRSGNQSSSQTTPIAPIQTRTDENGITRQVHGSVMDNISYSPDSDPNLTGVTAPRADANVGGYPTTTIARAQRGWPFRAGDFVEVAGQLLEGRPKDLRKIIGLDNLYSTGGILDAASFVGEALSKGIVNAQITDTKDIESEIKAFGNTKLEASNNDELMSLYDTNTQLNTIRGKDLKKGNFGTDFLKSVGTSLTGAQKGLTSFGPIGGIVGAAVGGVSSLTGSIIGRARANKEAKKLNKKIEYANLSRTSALENVASNIADNANINLAASYSANGGPINMNYTGVMSPFGNRFDLGGKKDTIFDNGITFIDNGGTHESSPFEGVPMGVSPEGKSNLVEEGEVIWNNNYVFSDRLKVPKAIRQKYNLRGNKELTFADAAKQMQKESEERPNDPISMKGLEDSMTKLMTIQEMIRQQENSNKYEEGGGSKTLYDTGGSKSNRLNKYKYSEDLAKDTDFYDSAYLSFWDWMDKNRTSKEAVNWLNRINKGEFGNIGGNTFTYDDLLRLARDYKKGPVHNAFYQASREYTDSPLDDDKITKMAEELNRKNVKNVPEITKAHADNLKNSYNSLDFSEFDVEPIFNETLSEIDPINIHPLRYSSAVGQFASTLNNLLGGNNPDYGNLASFEGAVRNIKPVRYTPIGNYLTYKPFDRNYYQNMLSASSNATRRAARNVSGGNRAQALASILAADYNEGIKLGELARQAEEYNLARRQQVEDFNRATNMFNSELGFKASATNAELDARRAALLGELARMREVERLANRKEKIDANTAFLTSLDNIGREKTYLDMLRWMGETDVLRGESKNAYDPEFFNFWNAWQEHKKNNKTNKTNR